MPPALHLHLWHHVSGVSIYLPERRMAHHGTGDVLYWFHSGSRLAENARWPRFVQQRPVLCRPGNLHIVIAGLFCDTGRVHTAFSPGTPAGTPRLHRHMFDSGGACGVSTSRLVDMQCICTAWICDYVCRRVDNNLPCILCSCCRCAFCLCLHAGNATVRLEKAFRSHTRDPQTQRASTHGTRTAHTEGLRTPVGERDTPAQCNRRRS